MPGLSLKDLPGILYLKIIMLIFLHPLKILQDQYL